MASAAIQVPCLMLSEEGEDRSIRHLVSPLDGTTVHKVELPEARGKMCIGSLDWLITIDEQGNMELLHPLNRVRIPLPHATAFKYYEEEEMLPRHLVQRAALSASPTITKDYVLMIITGSRSYTAFWKPGNTVWTVMEPRPGVCRDIIYYKDQFYAINIIGNLLHCDPSSATATVVGQVPINATCQGDGEVYLVESGDELLVVSRGRDMSGPDTDRPDEDERYWTCSFRIFRFNPTKMNKCEEINDLGGSSIFVGHSDATSIDPSAAAAAGVKPNCIYFTDDYIAAYTYTDDNLVGGTDMGVYSLESRTTEPLITKVNTPLSNYCPAMWVCFTTEPLLSEANTQLSNSRSAMWGFNFIRGIFSKS